MSKDRGSDGVREEPFGVDHWNRSLKDERKGTGESGVQVAGCAKALGLERLGVLEEQKGGHMAGVLR